MVTGGVGGAGGYARGGAIFVDTGAGLWIENTTIASNHADAGNGGTGGAANSGLSSIHGGTGGTGGNAYAGLVYVAVSASIVDLEFSTLANGNFDVWQRRSGRQRRWQCSVPVPTDLPVQVSAMRFPCRRA